MNITTIGIDLAKKVFQVHGVDERGKPCLKKQIKRAQMLRFFAMIGTPPADSIRDRGCGLDQVRIYGRNHFLLEIID